MFCLQNYLLYDFTVMLYTQKGKMIYNINYLHLSTKCKVLMSCNLLREEEQLAIS